MEPSTQNRAQPVEPSNEELLIVPATEDVPETIKPASGEAGMLRQIELGFMFDHSLLSASSQRILAASTAAFALADLLVEKGVIEEEALKARRDEVQAILLEQEEHTQLGLFVNEEHQDKYALSDLPQINCTERVHLCKAACCALRFPLSRQDVEEGIVRWDFGRPYWNLREQTGYCIHNDQEHRGCQIYQARPGPCRLFDCRQDKRIWLDFEEMIVSPNLEASFANMPK